MPSPKIRRALIAVYDKTGIVDFARALHDEFGIEIISTGGTAKVLTEAGIPVTLVEQVTGFPELLGGRVKTLHPKIHAAILADRDNPDHMRQLKEHGIDPIDMVVVNLYPFEKTIADPACKLEDALEMIDIGGPCLLRAAAKNHKHVLVVSGSDSWYPGIIKTLRGDPTIKSLQEEMRNAAFETFGLTGEYDRTIYSWLGGTQDDDRPVWFDIPCFTEAIPRYGENPHQVARLLSHNMYEHPNVFGGVLAREGHFSHEAQAEMSYNNYVDADAALQLCMELSRSHPDKAVACFIKHTNPCGVGVDRDFGAAYQKAYLGDPNAAMGGILAGNVPVNPSVAELVMETYQALGKPLVDAGHAAAPGGFFVEVWIARNFDPDAIQVIDSRKPWGKRVRLVEADDMLSEPSPDAQQWQSILGGLVMQSRDLLGLNEDQWKVVTQRPPTESEMSDLRLAWLIAKHTKSNAISICKDGMLIGNGAGQMSRVMSCRIATWLANENGHADKLRGAAAASDGFFPFRDGPDLLLEAGVTALIQPGGSKRDAETIQACDERNAAMICTGTRHFKH